MTAGALLATEGLVKHFDAGGGKTVHAVDGVTLAVRPGETLALVGESGCGKSTLGRCMLRLYEPTSGTVRFDGVDITRLSTRRLRPLRRRMQMVFQDPYSSLNPRRRVGDILGDVMRVHRRPGEIRAQVGELLERVGLQATDARRYAREFSGGQRQRIGIARALAVGPDLIVADEPVSALDVSIQAQIVNLLVDLQEELALTCVFITHDLAIVRQVSDRIGVMYLGKLVELADRDDLYRRPVHPYTEGLLAAVPIADVDVDVAAKRERAVPLGDLPDPTDPPRGCRFHTRCRHATDVCRAQEPPMVDHGHGRLAACHHPLNVGRAPSPTAAGAV